MLDFISLSSFCYSVHFALQYFFSRRSFILDYDLEPHTGAPLSTLRNMSFPMEDLPSSDKSRLGTANSFQDQVSISGVTNLSGLSSITLVDSTAQLQKPKSLPEISMDDPETMPKARSKLRLFSILFALYVCFHPTLSFCQGPRN